MKNRKRWFAAILTVLMMLTAFPAVSYAGEAQDLEWWNFRNSEYNNSVTDRPAITTSDEAWLKWAVKYGTGYAAAPTPPLILDGHLYIGVSNQVKKLDIETGECVATSGNMVANVGYAMNPILYADGRLFVQVGNGMIQCLDYETLEPLWSTDKIGGQTVSPISYIKINGQGYVYTGTWNGEKKSGVFMCVSTDDSNVTDGKKAATWMFTPKTDDPALAADDDASPRGFYWAGAYCNENYIAIGSDDGTNEGDYTANAVLYTLNPATGAIIDRVDQIKGDIRSTVVYDSGYLYFTTKGGLLNRVPVDEDGQLGELQQLDMGGMITAACAVYNGRLYVGVCGQSQFSPDSGHRFAVVDVSGDTMHEVYSLPIKGYPQAAALVSTSEVNKDFNGDGAPDGRVYIYFTYNYPPGGIYYVYDEPGQTAPCQEQGEIFVPASSMQQYCISTIIADREGTLYYKNDSCYLMAIERNLAPLNNLQISSVTQGETAAVELDKEFAAGTAAYSAKLPSASTGYQIELTMPADVTATVNGEAYTADTPMSIEMTEESATATIVTTATNGDTRTYTVLLEKQSADSSLADLKISSSNTYNSSLVTLTPGFDAATTSYATDQLATSRAFYNLWPETTSAGATFEVIAGDNIKNYSAGATIPVTSSTGGHTRYAIYAADQEKDQTVTVKVTSENGESTTSYTVKFCRQIYVTGVSLNQTEAELAAGETLALVPTIEPSNASVKDVTWETSDQGVATVDADGIVTAVASGTADITAKTVDGDFTAVCKVTVPVDMDAVKADAIAELKAYADPAAYREAEAAELAAIIEQAEAAIGEASTEEEVAGILTEAKAAISALKTAADFDEEAAVKNGWVKEDGEWYYYKNNAMLTNGWAKDSAGWMYMNANGRITKNAWIKDGGEWYFLKASGYMAAKEWAKDSVGWMYMNASGKITRNAWIKDGGEWYFLKSSGYMAANEWTKDSAGWMYMNASGKITKSKWVQYKGDWYYLKSNGYMATGKQTIGGRTYTFTASGKWID